MNQPILSELQNIYGETSASAARFRLLAQNFQETYHWDNAEFFSSPGRTEIIGNHTDHNGGMILAASISMDTIGAAWPNGTDCIRITSEGYPEEIVVDLNALEQIPRVQGTQALTAGIMEALLKAGFQTGGFDAYVSTEVISAAGVSSSASYEMLICSIVNYFFNDRNMTCTDYAKAGQYAENVYWNKASGLMDQMACAVGGAILLDFSDQSSPKYEKVDFSFQEIGYRLMIVNTGKGHADLSQEYSSIPLEMKEVAAGLHANLLCETNIQELLLHLSDIKNDRAILRALHFFKENERVQKAALAIENGNLKELLSLIEQSGTSSWEWLQNCYPPESTTEQKIPLTLALTRLFLEKTGKGVCRIHGGGFAGVIMCVLPDEEAESYMDYIAQFVGKENVYSMNLRSVGAVHVASDSEGRDSLN